MEIAELLAECRRKQRVSGRVNVGVYLTLPVRRLTSRQNYIRLLGRLGGPLGEILNVTDEGLVVALFPADGVIRALHRLIQQMVKDDPEAAWKALIDMANQANESPGA
jgi:hypothetical protein